MSRNVAIIRNYNFNSETEAYLIVPDDFDIRQQLKIWGKAGYEVTGKSFVDYLLSLKGVSRYEDMEIFSY